MADERGKAIDLAFAQIEKQFGKGSIMRLGSKEAIVPIAVIPTGSISFDAALGVGGFPRGRVIEDLRTGIVRQDDDGAAGHRRGAEDRRHGGVHRRRTRAGSGVCARNSAWTSTICWSRSRIMANRRWRSPKRWSRSDAIDVVVMDSVAALVPKAELEGEMGDSHMGLQARLMSQALRKLTGTVSKSRTCLIFINQIREKIGVMFGNPETTTGGRALKFYSSVRMDIRRIAAIKEGDVVTASRTKVKVVKNKVAAPFREAEFDIHVWRRHLAAKATCSISR